MKALGVRRWALGASLVLLSVHATSAMGSATGLNTIPTTDLVPPNAFIFSIQNGNTAFQEPSLWMRPTPIFQSQYGFNSWLEGGVDYMQTPDLNHYAPVFNAKFLLHSEDDRLPGLAAGLFNVTSGQGPSYYLTLSKTLNYDQQQRERFRAHHRRNRKLLGRRVHFGLLLDTSHVVQPFFGTDIQLSESAVFQADWTRGPGNQGSVGLVYVMPDQRTVINPSFLFSNDTHRFAGFQLNLSHQF